MAFPPKIHMHSSSPLSCYIPCTLLSRWRDRCNYIQNMSHKCQKYAGISRIWIISAIISRDLHSTNRKCQKYAGISRIWIINAKNKKGSQEYETWVPTHAGISRIWIVSASIRRDLHSTNRKCQKYAGISRIRSRGAHNYNAEDAQKVMWGGDNFQRELGEFKKKKILSLP
jgi:hypothetical protein